MVNKDELLKTAKPILFNTDMVRAILDGRKTQTRRVLKVRYKDDEIGFNIVTNAHDGSFVRVEKYDEWEDTFDKNGCERVVNPPYKLGDILYVRETWQSWRVKKPQKAIPVDFKEIVYNYRADGELYNSETNKPIKWRPSIHMPKEAARIFLKVTDVRVERLQECGKGWCIDIEKEGVVTPLDPILYIGDDEYHNTLREQFKQLWNGTIPKKDRDIYGWSANPWVWVVEFERLEAENGR